MNISCLLNVDFAFLTEIKYLMKKEQYISYHIIGAIMFGLNVIG
jgi:hypothetical protein